MCSWCPRARAQLWNVLVYLWVSLNSVRMKCSLRGGADMVPDLIIEGSCEIPQYRDILQ